MTDISSARSIVTDIVNARIGANTVRPYTGVVDSVITALVSRDEAIGEFLMEKAEEMELDPSKVRPILVQAGLLPAPALAAVPDADDEEMPSWARALMTRIEALDEAVKGKRDKKN